MADTKPYYLVETANDNNYLCSAIQGVEITGVQPGDKVTNITPLDLTMAEFAELANKAVTQILKFDTMSGIIQSTPKKQDSN